MSKNSAAVRLGKLGRGKPKTMSERAIEQRKKAAIASQAARKAKQADEGMPDMSQDKA